MQKNYLALFVTFLMFAAIPVTLYVANRPQEVRTSAQQITTPHPSEYSPTPTPTVTPTPVL